MNQVQVQQAAVAYTIRIREAKFARNASKPWTAFQDNVLTISSSDDMESSNLLYLSLPTLSLHKMSSHGIPRIMQALQGLEIKE